MTYRGVAKGRTIELEDALPFPEGQPLTVSVEEAEDSPQLGSAALVSKAVREPPHVDEADVDEMERLIAEGKLPVKQDGVFGNGR